MRIPKRLPLAALLAVLLGAALLAVFLGGSRDEPVPRSADDPTGYYEGTAKSQQAGDLDISLNLRQIQGPCQGELSTPVGSFPLTHGRFEAGRLRLRFDADGTPGTIDAQFADGGIHGTFEVGDDTGAIELRRVGGPRAAVSATPDLNLSTERWREDLHFFARELPKRHANAFHHVPQERFEAAVA